MSCQGDDKVLLRDDYKQIVSYDLKRDVFELGPPDGKLLSGVELLSIYSN